MIKEVHIIFKEMNELDAMSNIQIEREYLSVHKAKEYLDLYLKKIEFADANKKSNVQIFSGPYCDDCGMPVVECNCEDIRNK